MNNQDFTAIRKKLNKTQQQMAQILGLSVKAIESYEQGWRSVPEYVEKQMVLLVTRKKNEPETISKCWDIIDCPDHVKKKCPAWEFKAGTLCWFLNGTLSTGDPERRRQKKMEGCRSCKALSSLLDPFSS